MWNICCFLVKYSSGGSPVFQKRGPTLKMFMLVLGSPFAIRQFMVKKVSPMPTNKENVEPTIEKGPRKTGPHSRYCQTQFAGTDKISSIFVFGNNL